MSCLGRLKKSRFYSFFIFFALVFCCSSAFADRGMSYALSGGGAKGLAQCRSH